ARHKPSHENKIEQLILFPTDTGFVRMLSLNRDLDSGYERKVTAMFGHDRWKPIYTQRRSGQINAEGARTRYVQLYADGLRELGYEHVQERQIRKEGPGGGAGAPMYFLLHASDHSVGEKIMAHCFDKKHVRP